MTKRAAKMDPEHTAMLEDVRRATTEHIDSFEAFVTLPQGWPALVTIPASLHPCDIAEDIILAVHKRFEPIALVGGKTTYQTFRDSFHVTEVSSGMRLMGVAEPSPGKAIKAAQDEIRKVGAKKFRAMIKTRVAQRVEALKAPKPDAWMTGPKGEEPVVAAKAKKAVSAGKVSGPRLAAVAPADMTKWIEEHKVEYPLATHLVRAVATTFPDASVHQIRAALPDLNPSTVGIQVGKARK
jgi:hypothetical protein